MNAAPTTDATHQQQPTACYPITGQPDTNPITIKHPTIEALRKIAGNLCQADRDELAAAGLHDPLRVMVDSIDTCREAYVAWWDGEPQAVFGVNDFPPDPRHGIPWLLSTGAGHRHSRAFLTTARRMIEVWAPMYLTLRNVASEQHTEAREWLKALGFREEAMHTLNGHTFTEYARHV